MSQELFDEAIRLEEQGLSQEALIIWRQLAEGEPTRNVFLRLGSLTKQLGLIGEAKGAFARALEKDGRSGTALGALGLMAVQGGEYEEAIGYLERACKIKEDPGWLTVLGVALSSVERDAEAEEAYARALRVDPNYEEAYFNLGVLLRRNRPAEAQRHFQKALALDPDYAPAHRELGFLLMGRSGGREARRHLRKAVRLNPDDAWAHIYFGAHLSQTDAAAAEIELQIAAKLEPAWSLPFTQLGQIYESQDLDAARARYEQALQLESDDIMALRGIARVCLKLELSKLAREYAQRALALEPDDERALAMLAQLDQSERERE